LNTSIENINNVVRGKSIVKSIANLFFLILDYRKRSPI